MWGKVGSSWRVPVECGAGETPLSLARRAVHALSEKTLGIDSAEVSEREGLIHVGDFLSKLGFISICTNFTLP